MTSRFGSKLARLFNNGFTHRSCFIGKSSPKLLRARCDVDYYRGILQQNKFPEMMGVRSFHWSIFRSPDKNLNLTKRNYRALANTLNDSCSAKSELIHQKPCQLQKSASYATAPTKKTHDKASCKVGKTTSGPSKCPRLKVCNCEAPKKITCDSNYIEKNCKKKEAPYPSFSEACYEEPYNKPSECKICPWKAYDHPTFKDYKKHYHTSACLSFKHPPCDKDLEERKLEDIQKTFRESNGKINSKKTAESMDTEAVVRADPPIMMNREFTYLPSQQSIVSMEMATYEGREGCEDEEKDACVKFPFKKFVYIIPDSAAKKEQKKKKDDGECPFKPQRAHRKVVDCPPEEKKCSSGMATNAMLLMSPDGYDKDEKKECPDFSNTLCEKGGRRKCPKKRRPKIAPCQEDILPKKGWPVKKSRKPAQGPKKTSSGDISPEMLEMMLSHVTRKTNTQRPMKT